MSWSKAFVAGVVAGIALTLYEFVMHGMIMGNTYSKYPELFTQEGANPVFFVLVAVCISIFVAVLFAKTRGSWAGGLKGGATFGFFLGMVVFFARFYDSLVYEGYPYHLSWCQGGINLIGMVLVGAVLGLIYKK